MSDQLVLETDLIRAEMDVATCGIRVLDKTTDVRWETPDSSPHDLGYRIGGSSFETSFSQDHRRTVLKTAAQAYRIVFPDLNVAVGFALTPGREDEVSVTMGEADGGGCAVPMAGSYPRNFIVPAVSGAYTVLPRGMGMMIPGDWDQRIRMTYDADVLEDNAERLARYTDIFRDGRPTFWWDIHDQVDMDVTKFAGGPALNMYCARSGRSGLLCMVPTRFDWNLGTEHDPGQPTRVRHFWLPSFQRLRYDREVRYRICPDQGYVEMAKAYRDWLKANGGFKSLAEKAAELPHLDGARGGMDLQLHFIAHDVRRKSYSVRQTFEQGIGAVEDFRKRTGFDKANVTVRGWQKWGHDHHYPSLLPPNSDAGGAPGFRKLGQAVRDMGYHFELAGDNYHDIAYDSPDFSEKVVIRNADGSYNRYNMWASGMTSFLALPWSLKFLRRNFELGKMDYPQTLGLLELAPFDYYWIGNWGMDFREDYNQQCPMNREEHHRWVIRILNYIRSKGKVLEMEHSSEWVAPHLDRVKNREPASGKANEDAMGSKQGICSPLWGLVFHDSTVIQMQGMAWERQLVYGGYPKIGLPLRDDFEKSGMLEKLRIQTRLNETIGFDEMVSHEYVDGAPHVERCEYGSGITVDVDTQANTYRIVGLSGISESETASPKPRD